MNVDYEKEFKNVEGDSTKFKVSISDVHACDIESSLSLVLRVVRSFELENEELEATKEQEYKDSFGLSVFIDEEKNERFSK